MSTDGPFITKTFGSASPRGRRDVVSTVDRGICPAIVDENRHSGLRRLKSRSWSSIRRWEKENELLFAMIEDESEWLAGLFPEEIIAPEFFFFALEDGVLLCKLANLIQGYAVKYGKEHSVEIPESNIKYHPRNKTRGQLGQFRARENVTSFLGWCRKHRVPEVILFESNDVVQTEDLREGAREVVICLMEVARRSVKYGVKPPKLILLEKEIDEEERTENLGSPSSVDSGVVTELNSRKTVEMKLIDTEEHNGFSDSEHIEIKNALNSSGVWEDQTGSKIEPDKEQRTNGVSDAVGNKNVEEDETDSMQKPQSELDKKVFSLIEEYSVGKILRLKEGKYIILGRVMFVRMLNDHVLVRIGGGWDGLEHYLMTHVKTGSQSQNPPNTPANDTRSATPVLRSETKRTNRPLSPAASNNSLAEGNKGEFRTFTPPLQPSFITRGRESPLRKTSRVRDADEADIARAIRRIENTVSENIQKKTGSTSTLELTASINSCKSCSNNRKIGSSKMATSEVKDFTSAVTVNDDFERLKNNLVFDQNVEIDGGLDNMVTTEGAIISESSDKNNNTGNESGTQNEVPLLNGDINKEETVTNLIEDENSVCISENAMNVVVTTKNDEGKQVSKEKKTKKVEKKQTDVKATKTQAKSGGSVKSATSTKTPSKGSGSDKKAAPTNKKPSAKPSTAATKSTTTTTPKATTAATPKPSSAKSDKSVAEKKSGTLKDSKAKPAASKPIFKVSTSKTTSVSLPKSTPKKAGTAAGSKDKVAGTKTSTSKSATTPSSAIQTSAKPASAKSAATKPSSAKSDVKDKEKADSKKQNGEDTPDGAVLSTKGSVNGELKTSAQKKAKTPTPTAKAPAAAKKVAPTKTQPSKPNDKAGVDKTKAKPTTAKTDAASKVSAKATPANKADKSKSDSAVKKAATDSKSKPTTPAANKGSAAATAKSNEAAKKPVSTPKPSSAPAKAQSSARSSKPSTKPSSAPSSAAATKSASAASKPAKPAAKQAAKAKTTTTTTSGDKKSAVSKTKTLPSEDKKKAAATSAKALPAKGSKDVKSTKTASEKSAKVDKKDSSKASKVATEKKKGPGEDSGEKPVSAQLNVEQKEKLTIEAVIPSSAANVEAVPNDVLEPIAIKNSNEAVIIDSSHAEDVLTSPVDDACRKEDDELRDSRLEEVVPCEEVSEISSESLEKKQDELDKSDVNVENQIFEKEVSSKMEDLQNIETQESAENQERMFERNEQNDTKVNEEGSIGSPFKSSRSETFDLNEDERHQEIQSSEDQPCSKPDAGPTSDNIEEYSESAKFNESNLESMDEIAAKCDEDDIREGAVAPTPPETPVPDNATAEAASALELSTEGDYMPGITPAVTPMVEQPSQVLVETDLVETKDETVPQLDEITSALAGYEVILREDSTVEEGQKEDEDVEEEMKVQEIETSHSLEETLKAEEEDSKAAGHEVNLQYQVDETVCTDVIANVEENEPVYTEKCDEFSPFDTDERAPESEKEHTEEEQKEVTEQQVAAQFEDEAQEQQGTVENLENIESTADLPPEDTDENRHASLDAFESEDAFSDQFTEINTSTDQVADYQAEVERANVDMFKDNERLKGTEMSEDIEGFKVNEAPKDTDIPCDSEFLKDSEVLESNEMYESAEKSTDMFSTPASEVTEAPTDLGIEGDFETDRGFEVSEFAGEETPSPLSSGFTHVGEHEIGYADGNYSPSGQDERTEQMPYEIGSRGTEELMQRESCEEENFNDIESETDEADVGDKMVQPPAEADYEVIEAEDFKAEAEQQKNDDDVLGHAIGTNDVNIEVAGSHESDTGSSTVVYDFNTHDTELYDGEPAPSQLNGSEELGTLTNEQRYGGSDVTEDDSIINADGAQNEILNPEIGLQENVREVDITPDSRGYAEEAERDEMSDNRDDAATENVRSLDLKNPVTDASVTDEQFTPISDLPDDGRSPLSKESFSHFASGGEEEGHYEGRSDGEEEFDSEVLERAKESVRVARSLDDSCEEEKPKCERQDEETEAGERSSGDVFDNDVKGDVSTTVVPQVIASPCMSSDNEGSEDEEIEKDTLTGTAIEAGNIQSDLQGPSQAGHDSGFPDAITSDNLHQMYQAEADSHDAQFGFEKQLHEDQGLSMFGSEVNAGQKTEEGTEQRKDPFDGGVYNDGKEMSHGDQTVYGEQFIEDSDNLQGDVDQEEISLIVNEPQKDLSETSQNLFDDEATFRDQEGHAEVTSETTYGTSNDPYQAIYGGQYQDDDKMKKVLEEGVHGADKEDHDEDREEEEGMQVTRSENMAYEQEQCGDLFGTDKKEAQDLLAASTNEAVPNDEDPAFEDRMYNSQERLDAEKNIQSQSDDHATDSSDFVLLDSPIKHFDASNTDHPITYADTKESMQAPLNESGSEDSPFHHIELKPEEVKRDDESDQAPEGETFEDGAKHDVMLESGQFQDSGHGGDENQMSTVSSALEEQSMDLHSVQNNMGFSQNEDQLWKRDMHEDEKQFQSEPLSYNQSYPDNTAKFDNLVDESFNTGPRYVYDGSDDEECEEDYDDDETY